MTSEETVALDHDVFQVMRKSRRCWRPHWLVQAVNTLDALRTLESDLLGRRSLVTSWKKLLGALAPEDRRRAGQVLNETREALEQAVLEKGTEELSSTGRVERLVADRPRSLRGACSSVAPATSTS